MKEPSLGELAKEAWLDPQDRERAQRWLEAAKRVDLQVQGRALEHWAEILVGGEKTARTAVSAVLSPLGVLIIPILLPRFSAALARHRERALAAILTLNGGAALIAPELARMAVLDRAGGPARKAESALLAIPEIPVEALRILAEFSGEGDTVAGWRSHRILFRCGRRAAAAVSALESQLRDPDPGIRKGSLATFAAIAGKRESYSYVLAALTDPDLEVGKEARRVFCKLAVPDGEDPRPLITIALAAPPTAAEDFAEVIRRFGAEARRLAIAAARRERHIRLLFSFVEDDASALKALITIYRDCGQALRSEILDVARENELRARCSLPLFRVAAGADAP